jgi:hypothetical protein
MADFTVRRAWFTTSLDSCKETAMETRWYVLYDPENGEVVHVHFESSAIRSSAEEVMQHAGVGTDRRLELLELPASHLPLRGGRVQDGELREVDEDVAGGGGGGAGVFAEPDVTRTYERRR